MYSVKEIFLTLQGEGFHAGRAAMFCRFSGCNLWSGREQDRARAQCRFCDTDFVGVDGVGGGRYADPENLAQTVVEHWPHRNAPPFVVLTGGEPTLQLDEALIGALKARGCIIAIETNGVLRAPNGLDWICVSPKSGAPLTQTSGNELKLVYPQSGIDPRAFDNLAFEHFYLQPCDGVDRTENQKAAIAYCLAHPRWRLSVQTHKFLGIA